MTALTLERTVVTKELIEHVRREKQKTEEALNALDDDRVNPRALRAAGIPEAVLQRLHYDDDAQVLEEILRMRWDAFRDGIEKSLGESAVRALDLDIE